MHALNLAVPNGKESIDAELLDAHAHVWNHIYKFMIPMFLKCAVQLSIPDIIKNHGKPMSLSELTGVLHISKAKSHCLQRLMSLLVDSKFFVQVEEGYWLTPSSNLLLKDSSYVTPLLLLVLDPIMMKSFESVSEWFADDHATAFETAHGVKLWEKAETDSRLSELMNNEGMERHGRFESCVVLKDCENLFFGVESLVDVGGAQGAIAKAVADAFPQMKCIVLDLPHVVAGLEGSANLTYVGGNMFEAIPTAHAVLIKVYT
ncbi:trans-resveratrol di-O-methyltransferase [Dorcoceras hygrometricum]|uniref:Trans-resveratrol di-O-methyltransferase n=1 Tax=Dorcoceras hygrometricum TaxID=472368 RepID=A0A2Z7ASM7_9LAMI|nr:trans-resveratrol di-O-methyltransferase [Dorcoceras hygrometricum]